MAYESAADIVGYGGAAGGGKTDLLLGLAGTRHCRSIIFRRVFPSVRAIIERSREIYTAEGDGYNEQLHLWRLDGGRTVEFASVQYEQDRKKFQGRPHDLFGFDEATEFPEQLVRFLIGWNRTTVPGQRCRVVLTFNPPMDAAGEWVTGFFAPWLDPHHPRPAADGELRWYAMVGGQEIECPDGEPFEQDGALVIPRSRTFIHAQLSDNPILEATGYGATIDAMPEPVRSLLKGHFDAARVADPWQVIPSDWVRQAQARWTEHPPEAGLLRRVGMDIARGGKDQTVICRLEGNWCAPLTKYPGAATPDGATAAALVQAEVAEGTPINVDVIGVGASVYDVLTDAGAAVTGVNFAEAAPAGERDRSGKLKFRNLRAYAYWRLREALDPLKGDQLALPPDPELRSDLCAARWKLTASGIQIESKEDIADRLGRSPDCADALALAFLNLHDEIYYA